MPGKRKSYLKASLREQIRYLRPMTVAVLTVPYVATTYSAVDQATIRRHAASAASEIGTPIASRSEDASAAG